jgi:multidrug efflux pump subunit AcrA (membrane-fusion protein)
VAAVNAASVTAAANNAAAAAGVASREAALNALRANAASTPQEIAAAEAELAVARANVDATRVAGESAVADAQAARAAASADETAAIADVRAAESALTRFDAALSVRLQQADLVASDLALAKLKAGVQVPADEIFFVGNAPVRVSESKIDPAAGALVTVTNAIVAIDGSLRLEEAPLAEPGMVVLIDEPDLNIKATGKITRVADAPGTNGVDGFHVYFEVLVDDSPTSIVGASVRMKVPVESTGGSVLAVPVSALSLSADGSSRVQRDNEGTLEYVIVEPGLSANGFVAVEPLDGSLKAGDLVVIGFEANQVSR